MADNIIRMSSKFDMKGNYEPSDSETEYSAADKALLNKARNRATHDSDSEEEIYAFSESDDDLDKKKDNVSIADSDVEGQEKSDDDLPDSKAWGKKKTAYYSTDYVDEDYGGFGDDEEAALMEEQEAKNIQKKLLEQLGDEDFTLDFFKPKSTEDSKGTFIKNDLSQMSKRQKMQLFEKESPEFLGLIDDFKTKLTVVKDDLQPLLKLVNDGKIPKCHAVKFVKTNYELILNYCTNISFYLLLKSQRINIQNHPVVKRLYQYRQMLNKIEPIYLEVIKPQIKNILQAVNNNIKLNLLEEVKEIVKKRKTENWSQDSKSKKIKLNALEKDDNGDTGVSDNDSECERRDLIRSENDFEKVQRQSESEESGFSDNKSPNTQPAASQVLLTDQIGDKREITYQIAKNKGLTPKRKKEQRNPRVKHKLKYRKAKIRRKGAVREVRTEISRYSGESSGIKTNVKKSIKIK